MQQADGSSITHAPCLTRTTESSWENPLDKHYADLVEEYLEQAALDAKLEKARAAERQRRALARAAARNKRRRKYVPAPPLLHIHQMVVAHDADPLLYRRGLPPSDANNVRPAQRLHQVRQTLPHTHAAAHPPVTPFPHPPHSPEHQRTADLKKKMMGIGKTISLRRMMAAEAKAKADPDSVMSKKAASARMRFSGFNWAEPVYTKEKLLALVDQLGIGTIERSSTPSSSFLLPATQAHARSTTTTCLRCLQPSCAAGVCGALH